MKRLVPVVFGTSLAAAAVVFACSSFDGTSTSDDKDATVPNDVTVGEGGGVEPDANVDSATPSSERPCAGDAPFGAPKLVDVVGANGNGGLTSAIYSATFSEDELTMIFEGDASGLGNGHPLYQTTRTSISAGFGDITSLTPQLGNIGAVMTAPSLSADGNVLVYSVEADAGDGGVTSKPFVAERLGTGGFGNADAFKAVTMPIVDLHIARIDAGSDTHEIWATDLDGGTNDNRSVLAFSRKIGTKLLIQPRALVVGAPNPSRPISGPNAEALYYVARGVPDSGVWTSDRVISGPKSAPPFGDGHPLGNPSIDALKTVEPTWASPNACRLYFIAGAPDTRRLYVVERPHQP